MKGGSSGKRTATDERGLGYSECGWVKGKGSIKEEQFSSKLREGWPVGEFVSGRREGSR